MGNFKKFYVRFFSLRTLKTHPDSNKQPYVIGSALAKATLENELNVLIRLQKK